MMDINKIIRHLAFCLPENQISVNVPMKEHTTFRTGGSADLMLTPSSAQQIAASLKVLKDLQVSYFIIGKGSNLIVRDGGFRGAVIKLTDNFSGIAVENNQLQAQAGTTLTAVVRAAHENGLCGMEYASGIPGTVGGAVVMNAGAYGGEIKDQIKAVKVLDRDFNELNLFAESLGFGYRKSVIAQKQYIVLEAVFNLEFGNTDEAKARLRELNRRRREKQPLDYPSAGSTFKRPPGHFAGGLIEAAGLKGLTIGGAQVSEKHAGFIINAGNATSSDILNLIETVRQRVLEKSGILLETEVKIIGEDLK